MEEIAISPSAGSRANSIRFFISSGALQMAMEFRSRRRVVPPSQQRGSEQVWQVNPGSKGDGLPKGVF